MFGRCGSEKLPGHALPPRGKLKINYEDPTINRHGRQGFTLIELLIVVVIIGILAAIAIPKFSSTREKAFKSAIMSDLKNLATQEEIYHNQYFAFAGTLADAQATESEAVTVTINESSGTGWSVTASHAGVLSQQCGIYHGDAVAADRHLVRHRESARVDQWAGPGELQPTLRPT